MKYPIIKMKLGDLDINNVFFDSFKEDYLEYKEWFDRKKNDDVYVATDKDKGLIALLKLKIEDESEDYSDIIPTFSPKKRLKICSLKVSLPSRSGIGKTFIEITLESAIKNNVEEIYVTLYNQEGRKDNLVRLLEQSGYNYWGHKNSEELVYVLKLR